jgi:hypothetical protein
MDEGRLFARVLFAIFKGRPNLAYTIFVLIIVLVLGTVLLLAQNFDDIVPPILGLAFVLIVVGGRVFSSLRQHSIQDLQELEPTPLEQEPSPPQMTAQIQPQPMIVEAVPEQEAPQSPPEDQPAEVPSKRGSPLINFIHEIISGPGTIRNTFVEQGPAKAASNSIRYSLSLMLFFIILFFFLPFFMMVPTTCVYTVLILFSEITPNPITDSLLLFGLIVLIAPFALIILLMLLSDLAAIGFALLAVFGKSEEQYVAAKAFFTGTILLILQGYPVYWIVTSSFPD